jgi:hypothetical protein
MDNGLLDYYIDRATVLPRFRVREVLGSYRDGNFPDRLCWAS